MARPDPLTVLRLLQRIEMDAVKGRLAEAGRQLASARAAEVDIRDRLAGERRDASAADFAAWLPAAKHEVAEASARERDAVAGLANALAAAVRARLSEQMLAAEVSRRAAADRSLRRRMEQVLLEDLRPPRLTRLGS